jgi:hypothetical protein
MMTMLFRAIFWIGLVAILMPHEPDLGLGRPSDRASLANDAMAWVSGAQGTAARLPGVGAVANAADVCNGHAEACGNALGVVDWVQGSIVPALERVKGQIEEQQRTRNNHI